MDPETNGEAQAQDPKGGEASAQDPQKAGQQPQDPKQGEAQAQDPGKDEGDTVNRHKYDRDIQRRDETIAGLQRQLKELNDAKAASGDQTAQLRKEMDELKRQLADEKANGALTAAGCVDLDLGRAALGAYDGDVAKLKEAKPYLFGGDEKTPLSTGGRPGGPAAPGVAKTIREGLRNR